MWEKNAREGSAHPHHIEVVDIDTGAVRYIKSGSKVRFVEGTISDLRKSDSENVYRQIRYAMGARKMGLRQVGNSKHTQQRNTYVCIDVSFAPRGI